jgi:hypothetical protein
MRKTTASLALASLLACASIAAPARAEPPSAAEADGHFHRGVDLYKEADYRAALIEFRRAYDLAPAYQVLYNIGETSYQLQDYAAALKTLEQYLSEGGARLSSDRRAEVEKEVAKLRLRVAKLVFVTPLADVEISVDDVAVGKTPLDGPLVVSAGRRKIVASKAGRPSLTKLIDVAGGDTLSVPLTLAEADAAPSPSPSPSTATAPGAPTAPAPPAAPASVPVWPWVTTGALTAGAVITGILALGASSDLRGKLAAFPANPDDITSARGTTKALALTTDVLIGAAAVMGGVSIYLTVASRGSSDHAGKQGQSPVVRLGATPGGVRVLGTF